MTGEDNFPECLSANLRHDIDVDLAVKYEKEYLGEELINARRRLVTSVVSKAGNFPFLNTRNMVYYTYGRKYYISNEFRPYIW